MKATISAKSAENLGFKVEVDANILSKKLLFPLYYAYAADEAVTYLKEHAPFSDRIYFAYQHQFGTYPHRDKSGAVYYGGLPMYFNKDQHIQKLTQELARYPEDAWLAIDYEHHEALPHKNYADLIEEWANLTFPDEETKQQYIAAQWYKSVLDIHLSTIEAIRNVRPDIKIGWYFSQNRRFWSGAYGDTPEADFARLKNDMLAEVWRNSDFISASVYLFYPSPTDPTADRDSSVKGVTYEDNRNYIVTNINEWQRLNPNIPVLATYMPTYHPSNPDVKTVRGTDIIPEAEMVEYFKHAHDAGADGILIWGAGYDYKEGGTQWQEAVKQYGPAFIKTLEYASNEHGSY